MSTSLSTFDDEDDEESRENQSSSDLDSRDGDPGTSNKLPSLTLNAYLTPDARSTTGSVTPRAKEKLARLCGGRKCILTHEHVRIRSMLALTCPFYSWKNLSLRLASATDKFILIRRVHWSISNPIFTRHMGWFLLLELHVIQEIFQFTVAREGRTYKEFSQLPEVLNTDWCLSNSSRTISGSGDVNLPILPTPPILSPPPPTYDQIYPIGLYPLTVFESLPILESRANPFFVIANAGPKLQANMNLLPSNWISRVDIMTVNTIWTLWMGMKPTPQWRAGSYSPGRRKKDGSQGPPDRRGGSPVPRRNPSRSGAGSGGGGPSDPGLAHTAADLPELDSDHQSAGTESDILTHDAVRSVVSLDRTEFLQKWLQEDHWMNPPGVEV
ncbi:hypothetical protein MVEN_01630000 [Mycena venus]|uniref:Uncharacterized protein n=1 Tax=Mycena venus TaxID=2733690 RepID=A0A8H7CQN4_9AGAR|nr:hypothetical protein MVEN_01630000 [Mycena venus]